MSLGERLKKLRLMRNKTQQDVADALGISRARYANYEQDRSSPDMGLLQKIANYFGVTLDYLISGDTPEAVSNQSQVAGAIQAALVPVLGVIRAGEPIFAEENVLGFLHAPSNKLNPGYEHFYLRVVGDSMVGDGILPGDFVLVRKQDYVEDGDIAVVIVNGEEATVKRVKFINSHIALIPSNPAYKVAVFPPEDVIIIGKVLMVVREVE